MKSLRAKTGLTQSDIAMFIRQPRTNVNMSELGKRTLNGPASVKLLMMEAALEELTAAAKTDQPVSKRSASNSAAFPLTWEKQEEETAIQLIRLKRELAEKITRSEQLQNWMMVLEKQLAIEPQNETEAWEQQMLNNWKFVTGQKLQMCDEYEQAKIAIKIAGLSAEQKARKAWRKKLAR